MIWHPRPGQRVRIHYAKRYAGAMPYHGATGVVLAAGGCGPVNAAVATERGRVIVPRGNLILEGGAV